MTIFTSCEKKEKVLVNKILLEKTNITLNEGEKAVLTAVVLPENADNTDFSWSSADSEIAVVDENGVITAIKEGNTQIIATTEESGFTAKCDVTVLKSDVPANSITLSTNYIELIAEETYQLNATLDPDDAQATIIWSSSNENAALIDENGLVTAIAYGETIISATIEGTEKFANCLVKVSEDNIYIPDPALKAMLLKNFDKNGDKEISYKEGEKIYNVNCRNLGVVSLEGIQHFPNMTSLLAADNPIETLNVESNGKLETLEISYTKIVNVDVSNNPTITKLLCNGLKLTTLDITSLTNLQFLYANHNSLKSLDLSRNAHLSYIDVANNSELSALDLSSISNLSTINVDSTNVTTLDLSKFTYLEHIKARRCNLSSLDLTKNRSLVTVYVDNNNIASLDLSNSPSLKWLYCSNNFLAELKIGEGKSLERMDCSNNKLAALDLSSCPVLKSLKCGTNLIANLDVSKCSTDLSTVECAPMPTLLTLTISSAQTKISSLFPKRDNTKIPSTTEIITVE